MALPNNFWIEINKWTFRFLILMFGIFAVCAILALFSTQLVFNLSLYTVATAVAQMSLIMGAILMIAWIVSGIAGMPHLLNSRKQKQASEIRYPVYQDDKRMNEILSRLNDDEQAYIREQLALKNMGLSTDGELTSLDEILKEDEH